MDFGTIQYYVNLAFTIYQFMIFIYIIMSWVPNLQASKFGEVLGKLVEPYLSIFRKIIPPIGMFDFSPILALLVLPFVAQGLLIVLSYIL